MPFPVSPLISAEDLAHALSEGHSHIKIVDASFALPGTDPDPCAFFQKTRIANAVFFDIDAVSDTATDLPHMLPDPDTFARSASSLGISNDDTVVIYGQTGTAMGPARVWWTFRVFGHTRVQVLDGGLPYWQAMGHPVSTDAPSVPVPGRFVPTVRPDYVADRADVARAKAGSSARILDARPAARFDGSAPEPRPGLRSGCIPGSGNLPCASLINPETGLMKSPHDLRRIFEGCEAGSDTPVIATCGSGVTACVIALALAVIGREDVRVYDGSWAEWGREAG